LFGAGSLVEAAAHAPPQASLAAVFSAPPLIRADILGQTLGLSQTEVVKAGLDLLQPAIGVPPASVPAH
jgi:hypothetical protein